MEIHIKGRADVPNYREELVVEIKVMFGDADGYQTFEVGPFKNENKKDLQDLLQTCERMSKAYPHGRGGGSDYNHVDGFNRWFDLENTTDDEYESLSEFVQNTGGDWPYEPDGMGYQSSYQSYKLFYYDAAGVKHNASVTGLNE